MKKDNSLELIDPSSVQRGDGVLTSGVVTKKILTEEELKYLKIRRDLELETIMQLDKSEIIPRKECWYMMDSRWLNAWSLFVQGKSDEEPGKVTARDLLDETKTNVLTGLKPNIDYR